MMEFWHHKNQTPGAFQCRLRKERYHEITSRLGGFTMRVFQEASWMLLCLRVCLYGACLSRRSPD